MTSRFIGRLGVLLVVSGLYVVVAPAARALDPAPAPQVTSITVEGGTLRFVATIDGAPSGQLLDPSVIRLTVGGQPWPTSVEPLGGGKTVTRTAVLVVDTSGSMGARGISDARAASENFLSMVPADVAVGLVTFADAAQLVVPPTVDRSAVRTALSQMRPAGNTSLYDGMQLALDALGDQGERALLVLSDGKDTSSTATLVDTAARLSGSGVKVDLVAFRTDGGQVEALNQLAGSAKGRLLEASDGGQLKDVFATAARTLVNQVSVTASVPAGTPSGPLTAVLELPSGRVPFDLPAAAPGPPATTAETVVSAALPRTPGTPGTPWALPLIALVLFVGLFMVFAVVLTPTTWGRGSSASRAREMQRYALHGTGGPARSSTPSAVSGASQAALGLADRAVQARGVQGAWSMALDRADIALRPQEWLIIRLAIALAAMAVAVIALPWWLVTAPLLGVVSWLLAGGFVRLKAKRRLRRFDDNLPDVLQLVAGSLRSGFSLPQAIDNAATDGPEPIAGELSRALAESRLGVPLEDALDRVAERMASTDLTWTVMAIRIAREVGGNLAEVLVSTAETMRERGRIQRQVRVLSAEGRLSAYVLIGLPIGILTFMLLFRRSYVSPLVTDPIGWVMTTYGVLSVLVGSWWMSRLIKLEV